MRVYLILLNSYLIFLNSLSNSSDFKKEANTKNFGIFMSVKILSVYFSFQVFFPVISFLFILFYFFITFTVTPKTQSHRDGHDSVLCGSWFEVKWF